MSNFTTNNFAERFYNNRTEIKDLTINDELNDDNWFFFGSPTPIISIVAAYLAFVLYIGPKWMKNREAYSLKHVIMLYNVIQVMQNLYMLWVALTTMNIWRVFFSFNCARLSPDEITAYNYVIRYGFWIYTTNKVLDLCDTVFFVLRKKTSHISFLHVYHHSSMPILCFLFGKYSPGHEPTIVALCNTAIHVLMYSYYLLAAAGSKYASSLWLKRCLTQAQIIQFCVIIAYSGVAMVSSCGFNKYIVAAIIAQAALNLGLFVNFYRKAYLSKKKVKCDENSNNVIANSSKKTL